MENFNGNLHPSNTVPDEVGGTTDPGGGSWSVNDGTPVCTGRVVEIVETVESRGHT